jgi:hypothetical protein
MVVHEIGGIGAKLVPGAEMKKALSAGIGSILLRKPTLCLVAPLDAVQCGPGKRLMTTLFTRRQQCIQSQF